MPLRLLTFSESPPYLRYLVPETGQVVPSSHMSVHNYHDLRDAVVAHLKANGKPVPGNLDELLQDHICRQNPERFCADENGARRSGAGAFGSFDFSAILQGTRTLANWFMGGMQRVSDEEIRRRGSICSPCAFNRQPEGCTSCNMPALMEVVNTVVGGKDLPGDGDLRGCAVCMCSLRAKTRIPLLILRKHTSAEQLSKFPRHCWMLDEMKEA